MTEREYLKIRHESVKLPDEGGYELAADEMNPVIVTWLAGVMTVDGLPPVVWEPFGGTGRLFPIAEKAGVELVSFGLEVFDKRVQQVDSTEFGVEKPLGGVIFHPPYFGSEPLSASPADLSRLKTFDEYSKVLQKTVDFARIGLVENGVVCAVGRDYRIHGQRIRMDRMYLEVFKAGFSLKEVWRSEPDLVLVFRKKS